MIYVIHFLLLTSLVTGKREDMTQDRSTQIHSDFELDDTKAVR